MSEPRFVNRGFWLTLLALFAALELLLRAAAAAPPPVMRVLYGTTLSMYMEVEKRLLDAAPHVQVLALGDSLALTQFQPDAFAEAASLPEAAVFNAAYLAQTVRSQINLIARVGMERFAELQHVIMIVNPRRLTEDGNTEADVFRVAIADRDGPWAEMRRSKAVAPLLDYSRAYGLSRYLVGASWRQLARPDSWDEVEYLGPFGGVRYGGVRPMLDRPAYLYQPIGDSSEPLVRQLVELIAMFRQRHIDVVLVPALHHRDVTPFVDAATAGRFEQRMREVAHATGARWIAVPNDEFTPPDDRDFLDYAHLNRAGGVAYTTFLSRAMRQLLR